MRALTAAITIGITITVAGSTGALISACYAQPPGRISRPFKVVLEIDPGDKGTAIFHCHARADTGPGNRTRVYTHCRRG